MTGAYDPSRKYTFPKRVTIGKLSGYGSGTHETESKFPEIFRCRTSESKTGTSRSNETGVGAYFVLRKIIEECSLKDILGKYFWIT